MTPPLWQKTLLVLSTGLLFSHYVVSNSFVNPWTVASPDFSVHGISQAIILEWVIIFSSMGSSWPRDLTQSPVLQADSTAEPSGEHGVITKKCSLPLPLSPHLLQWDDLSQSPFPLLLLEPHALILTFEVRKYVFIDLAVGQLNPKHRPSVEFFAYNFHGFYAFLEVL